MALMNRNQYRRLVRKVTFGIFVTSLMIAGHGVDVGVAVGDSVEQVSRNRGTVQDE